MIWIIGDDNRDRIRKPVVTYALIILNIVIFFALQECALNQAFTYSYAAIPGEILSGETQVDHYLRALERDERGIFETAARIRRSLPVYVTILTSMFLHGGLLHLLGNMLYLFIFGDNVEDRIGKVWYILLYVSCGAIATLSHIGEVVLTGVGSAVPLVGASGAISGLLAAYVIFYPRKRVKVFLWFFWIFFRVIRVRAVIVIGVWFAIQLLSAYSAFGRGGGGVAYGAHVGGFLMGAIVAVFVRVATRYRQREFRAAVNAWPKE